MFYSLDEARRIVAQVSKAILQDPQPEHYLGRSKAYVVLGEFQLAERDYAALIDKWPHFLASSVIAVIQGIMQYLSGESRTAYRTLSQALQGDVDDLGYEMYGHFILSELCKDRDEPAEAVRHLTRCVELVDHTDELRDGFLDHRSRLLYKLGHYGDCVSDCSEMLRNDAKRYDVLIRRSRAFGRLKRWDEALADLNAAEQATTNRKILAAISLHRLKTQRRRQAQQ